MSALRVALTDLLENRPLSALVMEAAIGEIMDGEGQPAEIAAILTALRCRGESIEQLVGAARAMRARSLKIPSTRTDLLDTCGTGGDALHTFNISTATAFVAAAAGIPVAKHGNRSASSKSGSADVLEALGARLDLSPDAVAQCIDQLGIGFCFAQRVHSAMKHVAPVRQQLGFRTLFNLLGPLTNPAGARWQLLGASRIHLAELLAGALAELGSGHALTVCGNDELDEVALWGVTTVFEVREGIVTRHTWSAETFGLPPCRVDELKVDGPAESAAMIRNVLQGQPGAPRNIVLVNAAAALLAADRAADPHSALALATDAVDSRRALQLLEAFTALTHKLAG